MNEDAESAIATPPLSPSPAVVAALVDNHRRFLAFVERRVGSRAEAEEILQDAFARGLERAGEIRDEERAVAWFYRVLRNALVDHWRSRGAAERAAEALAFEMADAHQPAPEIAGELCRCWVPLLDTLKPEYAEILRRVDLGGERPSDFAAAAGISANNAMVRLHRARKALREGLRQSCGTCADHGCLDCSCGAPAAPKSPAETAEPEAREAASRPQPPSAPGCSSCKAPKEP